MMSAALEGREGSGVARPACLHAVMPACCAAGAQTRCQPPSAGRRAPKPQTTRLPPPPFAPPRARLGIVHVYFGDKALPRTPKDSAKWHLKNIFKMSGKS
jgi:hypothetical protein